MIQIKQKVIQKIEAHAIRDLPDEACGYLAGKDGIITEVYEMTNIDHSPEHFSFDPKEQFETLKNARSKGLQILANYHSHPQTPARPSTEDIRLAYDPDIYYMIISLVNNIDIKIFEIKNSIVTEQPYTIIE